MSISLKVAVVLRPRLAGQSEISVEGATVREVFDWVEVRHPGFKDRLISNEGNLGRDVSVFVNEENVRLLHHLDTPINDGDELVVLPRTSCE